MQWDCVLGSEIDFYPNNTFPRSVPRTGVMRLPPCAPVPPLATLGPFNEAVSWLLRLIV